jgi:hypothetical protein
MRHQKYSYTTKTILEDWANNFESSRAWLSKMNGVKRMRAYDFQHFCEFAGKSPDELLLMKSGFENTDVERLLDRFVRESSFPESLKWKSVIAARSFFRCNYRQLQSEAGRMEYTPKKTQRCPSKKQRLELYRACYNQRDRALICVVCCSAIAAETLTQLRWSHFEEDWERQGVPHISIESELLKGHGKGRYRGVRQETFVTPETKRELQKYRDFMFKQYDCKFSSKDSVFVSLEEPYGPLTYPGMANEVRLISERAGVGFSIHDGRRIVETALENVSTPRNWIQKVKGRKVRGEDAPYSKPAVEQLRQKYREALGDLEFLGQTEVGVELTADQQAFFVKFAQLMDSHPDKAKRFEEFLLSL